MGLHRKTTWSIQQTTFQNVLSQGTGDAFGVWKKRSELCGLSFLVSHICTLQSSRKQLRAKNFSNYICVVVDIVDIISRVFLRNVPRIFQSLFQSVHAIQYIARSSPGNFTLLPLGWLLVYIPDVARTSLSTDKNVQVAMMGLEMDFQTTRRLLMPNVALQLTKLYFIHRNQQSRNDQSSAPFRFQTKISLN